MQKTVSKKTRRVGKHYRKVAASKLKKVYRAKLKKMKRKVSR
jgi:hypothetical protein